MMRRIPRIVRPAGLAERYATMLSEELRARIAALKQADVARLLDSHSREQSERESLEAAEADRAARQQRLFELRSPVYEHIPIDAPRERLHEWAVALEQWVTYASEAGKSEALADEIAYLSRQGSAACDSAAYVLRNAHDANAVWELLCALIGAGQPSEVPVVRGCVNHAVGNVCDGTPARDLESVAHLESAGEPANATYLGNGVVRVGDKQLTLDGREGYVLEGLLNLGSTAKKDALVNESGCDDAPAILKRIQQKHPTLAPLITRPGGKGRGGYRTTILDGRTPT